MPLEAFLAGREVRSACSKGLPGAEHSPEGLVGFSWWSCPSRTRSWTPPLLRTTTPGCWVRPPGHLDSHPFVASVSLAKRAPQEAEGAQSGLRSDLSLASSFPGERPFAAHTFVSASARLHTDFSLQGCCEAGRLEVRSVEALARTPAH